MPRIEKITKSFVEKTPYSEKGQVAYWERAMPGFAIVFGKTAKTFIIQKDLNARTCRYTIGRFPHVTVEEARVMAREKLYLITKGIDPNEAEREKRKDLVTLRMVLESYIETRKYLKASTKKDYKYHMEQYLPDWLDILIIDVDKDMILARHAEIGSRKGHCVANGVMRVLRALYNHAYATFDLCPINPVSYLSKMKAWYPEKRRRTYIKPHDLKAWWAAVHALESDTMRDFLLLLLFTGLRRGEASQITWENIDFKERTLTIHNTKNGDPLVQPLADFIYEMLLERKRRYGNYIFVFPGTGKHGYLAEPKKAIYKVTELSGVIFTCHDLRRTFVTYAESQGLPYYALKKLVNHRVSDVTAGYVIIDFERLREPVQRIADYILEKANAQKAA